METDKHKQRRNLIGVAVGLTVFQFAGGTVERLSLMDGGIKVAEPDRIILLAYLSLAYICWRYWLYTVEDRKSYRDLIAKEMKSLEAYQNLIKPLVADFRGRSGAENWEAFMVVGQNSDETERTDPISLSTETKPFRRILVISVDNPRGDSNNEEKPLPFWAWERLWLRVVFCLVFTEKSFSDLYLPYLFALAAIGGLIWK